jgi:hypothetical protein
VADKGTLFLDEIGDITPELQPKLLRVLQEQEFERLGSTRTVRVAVRFIAATNRDLGQMVAERQFRGDLFYRLNVFPLSMPPLRDRPEDITLLVGYFVKEHARRLGRSIASVPAKAVNALKANPWPGNVRELENFIERAVLLSPGPELRVPVDELRSPTADTLAAPATLDEAEREHILQALKQTNWVVGGPTARGRAPPAAELLVCRRVGRGAAHHATAHADPVHRDVSCRRAGRHGGPAAGHLAPASTGRWAVADHAATPDRSSRDPRQPGRDVHERGRRCLPHLIVNTPGSLSRNLIYKRAQKVNVSFVPAPLKWKRDAPGPVERGGMDAISYPIHCARV